MAIAKLTHRLSNVIEILKTTQTKLVRNVARNKL